MRKSYETELYKRIHEELNKIKMIDCHEHLQRDSELPRGDDIHIGRLFSLYACSDLISSGMPISDMNRVITDSLLSPKERWNLLEPWYKRAYNTTYFECLRIAIRDIFGIDDFSSDIIEALTEQMHKEIKPGFTRKLFDKANIDFAMTNPFGPKLIYNPEYSYDCFICDMHDDFTMFDIQPLAEQSGIDILCLDDYLRVIDFYFERDGYCASGFKVTRAYDRILLWEDVSKGSVESIFNRLLAFNDQPDRRDIQKLEDFIMHYLCRKCGEYDLRMKFHTGCHEGNGNHIKNSRAALMTNLFLKYGKTDFDIFHISYPYQEEATLLAKSFANVTLNFCWNWLVNPSAGRRALSDMLDTIPANKIHGFGGDYLFVEGTYGHAVIARREIARVLCEKIGEGRFSEEYAVKVGRMLLRDNPIDNFGLNGRRKAFKERVDETGLTT